MTHRVCSQMLPQALFQQDHHSSHEPSNSLLEVLGGKQDCEMKEVGRAAAQVQNLPNTATLADSSESQRLISIPRTCLSSLCSTTSCARALQHLLRVLNTLIVRYVRSLSFSLPTVATFKRRRPRLGRGRAPRAAAPGLRRPAARTGPLGPPPSLIHAGHRRGRGRG